MRVGFDLDGVLATFWRAYEDLCIVEQEENLFPPNRHELIPPVWDWPQHFGYTSQTVSKVWRQIREDELFWLNLPALPGMHELIESRVLGQDEVYFITARPGKSAKKQSESWLLGQGVWNPTVLMTANKRDACDLLQLDAYIDDKWENVITSQDTKTRVYLLDYPYNQRRPGWVEKFTRVPSVQAMLQAEERL